MMYTWNKEDIVCRSHFIKKKKKRTKMKSEETDFAPKDSCLRGEIKKSTW